MVDQDPEKYNTGGLLGVIVSQAIVAAISEYENLPTRYNMQFNCKNGGGAVKATQITTTNNSAFDAKTPTPLVQENKTDNDKNITPVVEATK
jgi:hypothetical protein